MVTDSLASYTPDAGFTFPAPSGVTVTLSLYVTTSSGLQEKMNKEATSKRSNFFSKLIYKINQNATH